jgi:hypothetical protein
VLLIVYGATAGVSVVQLYAGAFFPGIMLAALYVGYVLVVAKLKPSSAPPLSKEERHVALPGYAERILGHGKTAAVPGLLAALKGSRAAGVPARTLASQLFVALLPALAFVLVMGLAYKLATAPADAPTTMTEMGFSQEPVSDYAIEGGLAEPPAEGGLQEPPVEGGLEEPPVEGALEEPAAVAPARNRCRAGCNCGAKGILDCAGDRPCGGGHLLRLLQLRAP